MTKQLRIIAIMAVIVLAVAVGCSGASGGTDGGDGGGEGGGDGGGATTLNFYNWSEYIEPEIFALFEEETGIRVVEDTFGSNEDLFARLQGGATGYDVIVPSDYMVAIMIEEGMIAEIDHSQITNIDTLDPTFTDPPFDPGMEHCIPYFWGTTGIGFNWNDWDEAPDSWEYLFNPELAAEFDGRISMLDDMREALGSALIYNGYSVNSTDEAEIAEARDTILGVLDYIAAFDSDTYEDNMVSGEISLVHGWSGDVFTAQVEDENIDYVIPQEGAVIWMDNLCVTADAAADPDRYAAALQWIDFLTRPDIAAMNTNFVWYASPSAEAVSDIDPEILEYEAIYPNEETFARLEWLENVGDATEIYSRMWTEIVSN